MHRCRVNFVNVASFFFQFLPTCCEGRDSARQTKKLRSTYLQITRLSAEALQSRAASITDPHLKVELVAEASRRGHAGTFKVLLKTFDMNFQTLHAGHSILVEVLMYGDYSFAKALVSDPDSKADLTDDGGLNAVIACVLRGEDSDLMLMLLSKRFSVVSKSGKSALHVANYLVRKDFCELLVQAGAPVTRLKQIGPFWMTDKFRAAGFQAKEELEELHQPARVHRLKDMCRLIIRGTCRADLSNLFALVPFLPLPATLQNFVLWG